MYLKEIELHAQHMPTILGSDSGHDWREECDHLMCSKNHINSIGNIFGGGLCDHSMSIVLFYLIINKMFL